MIAIFSFVGLLQAHSDGQLSQLASERMDFDRNVVHSKAHKMEENIYSMGPGEQHIYGFYPMGKSDRRYLLATINSGHPYALLCQAIVDGKSRTVWSLRLRDSKKRPKTRGTLASMLVASYHAAIVGKLTKEEKRDLASRQKLAAYGFNGIMMLYAWIVQENGVARPIYFVPSYGDHAPYFPILSEESRALGLGRQAWPADLRYQLSKQVG